MALRHALLATAAPPATLPAADPLPQLTPLAYDLKTAVRVSGFSRSRLYEAAANGELVFRKHGRRVIILADELAALLRSLPAATIRQSPATVAKSA